MCEGNPKSKEVVEDPTLSKVNECADSLFKDIVGHFKTLSTADQKKPVLLMLHVLIGTSKKPYKLRRTAIRITGSSRLHRIASGKDYDPNEYSDKHAEALSEYIRYFNRDDTFLDLVVDEFKSDPGKYKEGLVGEIIIEEGDGVCYIGQDEDTGDVEWRIGEGTANDLVSQKPLKPFFESLYSNNWDVISKEDWKSFFDYCISSVYKEKLREYIRKYNADPKNSIKEKDLDLTRTLAIRNEVWQELAAYQTGILYFFESLRDQESNVKKGQMCSVILRTIKDEKAPNATKLVVAFISPTTDKKVTKKIADHLTDLGHSINLETKDDKALRNLINIVEKGNTNESVTQEYLSKVDSLFPDSYFEHSIQLYAYWLLYLSQKLTEKIHEGKQLSFYLLCGDKSEFIDSPNTVFKKFSRKQSMLFWLPIGEKGNGRDRAPSIEELEIHAEKIANLISQEHFPWFENGRHALFWDIGSDISNGSRCPYGIISLEGNNWKRYAEDIMNEYFEFQIPDSLLFAIDGDREITSTYQINGEETSEILRWKDKKWILWETKKRQECIRRILSEILSESDGKYDEISKIAVRLSENPQKGGTIVFVNKKVKLVKGKFKKMPPLDKYDLFGSMGQALIFDKMSQDDKIALISHDGSALHLLGNNDVAHWEFRKMLTTDEIKTEVICQLFEDFEDNFRESLLGIKKEEENEIPRNKIPEKEFCPLMFKGSRRWSGAMSVFHELIDLALIISQDGEMHLWYVKKEGKRKFDPKTVYAIEFKLDGTLKFFNMDEGYMLSERTVLSEGTVFDVDWLKEKFYPKLSLELGQGDN
ncbi:MAG: hypothetical protein KAS96_10190 [Planctomycetes bacterium]|nr:hypothetical protein [Planctomycetota bacterium]